MTKSLQNARNKLQYEIIFAYREVLRHLYETGIGNITNYQTEVTQKMIDIIEARLLVLKTRYNPKIIRRDNETRHKSNGRV